MCVYMLGGIGAGGEGDDGGWDGWMASLTWWTWVWVNSGSWWWTRRPGVLWFMGSQIVRHDWEIELNWFTLQSFLNGSAGKESACQCRRQERGFDPWVERIPWKRIWQPTPVCLPEKSHGQRSLTGYSPRGCKELDTPEWLSMHVSTVGNDPFLEKDCISQTGTSSIYLLFI